MEALKQHEIFEIETLQFMKSRRLLDSLIFGGGTMLRLCHGLNRYSADLDFYLKNEAAPARYFKKISEEFRGQYAVSDSHNKRNTMLLEIRHERSVMKLKIEINKKRRFPAFETAIAFSPQATWQVHVDTVPLKDMMNNKIEALLNRKEIRDAFDIEFLLRRDVTFPDDRDKAAAVLKVVKAFKQNDFHVKLGSLLPPADRAYYRQNRFAYLENLLMPLCSG